MVRECQFQIQEIRTEECSTHDARLCDAHWKKIRHNSVKVNCTSAIYVVYISNSMDPRMSVVLTRQQQVLYRVHHNLASLTIRYFLLHLSEISLVTDLGTCVVHSQKNTRLSSCELQLSFLIQNTTICRNFTFLINGQENTYYQKMGL